MNHLARFDDDESVYIDRLVDGELSPSEYREVLNRLDETPDGWRRCALAFLETQALRNDLLSVRNVAVGPAARTSTPPPLPTVAATPRATRKPIRPGVAVGIVASLLIAFGLGIVSAPAWNHRSRAPLANSAGGVETLDNGGTGVAMQGRNHSGPSDAGMVKDSAEALSEIAATRFEPIGHVTLVLREGDSAGQEIELPVYDGPDVASVWADEERRPVVSDKMRELLARMGHEIRSQRELVPVGLPGGGNLIVPIEQVEVVPIRPVSYQ